MPTHQDRQGERQDPPQMTAQRRPDVQAGPSMMWRRDGMPPLSGCLFLGPQCIALMRNSVSDC